MKYLTKVIFIYNYEQTKITKNTQKDQTEATIYTKKYHR